MIWNLVGSEQGAVATWSNMSQSPLGILMMITYQVATAPCTDSIQASSDATVHLIGDAS
jgi:hypothetical protein